MQTLAINSMLSKASVPTQIKSWKWKLDWEGLMMLRGKSNFFFMRSDLVFVDKILSWCFWIGWTSGCRSTTIHQAAKDMCAWFTVSWKVIGVGIGSRTRLLASRWRKYPFLLIFRERYFMSNFKIGCCHKKTTGTEIESCFRKYRALGQIRRSAKQEIH